jgi:hypothetical protein
MGRNNEDLNMGASSGKNRKKFTTSNLWGKTIYSQLPDGRWERRGEDGSLLSTLDKVMFIHPDYKFGATLVRGQAHYKDKNKNVLLPIPSDKVSNDLKPIHAEEEWSPLGYDIERHPEDPSKWRPQNILLGKRIQSIESL